MADAPDTEAAPVNAAEIAAPEAASAAASEPDAAAASAAEEAEEARAAHSPSGDGAVPDTAEAEASTQQTEAPAPNAGTAGDSTEASPSETADAAAPTSTARETEQEPAPERQNPDDDIAEKEAKETPSSTSKNEEDQGGIDGPAAATSGQAGAGLEQKGSPSDAKGGPDMKVSSWGKTGAIGGEVKRRHTAEIPPPASGGAAIPGLGMLSRGLSSLQQGTAAAAAAAAKRAQEVSTSKNAEDMMKNAEKLQANAKAAFTSLFSAASEKAGAGAAAAGGAGAGMQQWWKQTLSATAATLGQPQAGAAKPDNAGQTGNSEASPTKESQDTVAEQGTEDKGSESTSKEGQANGEGAEEGKAEGEGAVKEGSTEGEAAGGSEGGSAALEKKSSSTPLIPPAASAAAAAGAKAVAARAAVAGEAASEVALAAAAAAAVHTAAARDALSSITARLMDDSKAISARLVDDSKAISARLVDDSKAISARLVDDSRAISARIVDDSKAISARIVDDSKVAAHALQTRAKHLASQNKRRYQAGGFDLDLSYITDTIIAMSFPAGESNSGLAGMVEGLYRNHVDEVVRFLYTYHKGHYMVYNFCAERQYDPSVFGGKAVSFPFEDGSVPPLSLVLEFCMHARDWLAKSKEEGGPDNVVVVHCKAGLGRSGLMVACLLLFLKYYTSAEDAVNFFSAKRCVSGQAITIPSQLRYVRYFEALEARPSPELKLPPPKKFWVRGIRLHRCPFWLRPGIVIADHKEIIFSTRRHPKTKDILQDDLWFPSKQRKGVMVFALPGERGFAELCGDFQLFFQDRNGDFYSWLNTSFLETRTFLGPQDLDNFEKRRAFCPGLLVELVLIDEKTAALSTPTKSKQPGAPFCTTPSISPAPGSADPKRPPHSISSSSAQAAPAPASSAFSLLSRLTGAAPAAAGSSAQSGANGAEQTAGSTLGWGTAAFQSLMGGGAAAQGGGGPAKKGQGSSAVGGGGDLGKAPSRDLGLHPDIFSDSDDEEEERVRQAKAAAAAAASAVGGGTPAEAPGGKALSAPAPAASITQVAPRPSTALKQEAKPSLAGPDGAPGFSADQKPGSAASVSSTAAASGPAVARPQSLHASVPEFDDLIGSAPVAMGPSTDFAMAAASAADASVFTFGDEDEFDDFE